MNKVNTFPGVTAPSLLIILSNLFTTFEAAFEPILLTNPSKLFLAKAIARPVTTFFLPKSPNQEPRNPLDSIVLEFLSFTKF